MTASSAMKVVRALVVLACMVLTALLIRSCRGEAEAVARLEREQEAREIEKAGLEIVSEAKAGALRVEIEAMRRESADFAAALDDARAKLKDTRPILAARASTGPVPVEPRPAPSPGQEQPLKPDPFHADGCLLRPGDKGEVRVSEALLETRKGNRVLVGSALALRVDPGPPVLLFGGQFETPITSALGEPAPLPAVTRKRWIIMAGPAAALTRDGGHFGGSAGVVSPPLLFDRVGFGAVVTAGDGYASIAGMVAVHF
jgi:hypothetical protein